MVGENTLFPNDPGSGKWRFWRQATHLPGTRSPLNDYGRKSRGFLVFKQFLRCVDSYPYAPCMVYIYLHEWLKYMGSM